MARLASLCLISIALSAFAACGGGYGGGGGGGSGGGVTYTVGGTVSGLTGSGLVLLDNGGDNLAVSATGVFTFSAALANGAAYGVTVKTQPFSPAQNCVVTNGSGTVGAANVTNVAVVCANGVAHFAYAANADDNTISVYSIDSKTGALTAVGTPVATGLSPHAIAASPDGLHVYVANEMSNNVSAYEVNGATGVLTPIAGSPFPAGTNPRALAFTLTALSGTYLYVVNKGSNDLSAYSVNVSSGALKALTTATYATGTGPSAVLVDYSGSFVFVANNGDSNDISVFRIAAGGALTPVVGSPFAAGGSPHSLASSTFTDWETYRTLFLYTANVNGISSTISGFAVDESTGVLTALSGSPFPLAVSNDIATHPGGGVLYVTTGANVVGYNIDEFTGLLAALPGYPVAAGANAYAIVADAFNGFFYVGNDGDATVSGFRFDGFGGLIAIPGSPFPTGNRPDSLATL
jgi:6-phosphogluconolactonase (cycloisomerase 2 family)